MQKRGRIESIVDVRNRRGHKQYLVKWQDGEKEWWDLKELKSEHAREKIVLFEGERKLDGQLEQLEEVQVFMDQRPPLPAKKVDQFQKFLGDFMKQPQPHQPPLPSPSSIIDKIKIEFICIKNQIPLYSVGIPNEIPHLMTSKQIKEKYPWEMVKFFEQQIIHLAQLK